MRNLLLVILLLGLLSGCATGGDYERTELYFGQVTESQWKEFLDREVTPRFPDGLTVVDAAGQWKSSSGKIEKEHSKVLILVHRGDMREEKKIEDIRALFLRQFKQESVLRVTQKVDASF